MHLPRTCIDLTSTNPSSVNVGRDLTAWAHRESVLVAYLKAFDFEPETVLAQKDDRPPCASTPRQVRRRLSAPALRNRARRSDGDYRQIRLVVFPARCRRHLLGPDLRGDRLLATC